jgi:catechol 2,3-dioxygenase-like lactoylglutathione lyase family enzyme
VLPAKDVGQSIRYYVDKLGFRLALQDEGPEPRYAGVHRDGVELHLQWHDEGTWSRVERPSLRFLVEDVEALYDEYRGGDVFHALTALRDTPWGPREFAFSDRYGNGLTFYRNL